MKKKLVVLAVVGMTLMTGLAQAKTEGEPVENLAGLECGKAMKECYEQYKFIEKNCDRISRGDCLISTGYRKIIDNEIALKTDWALSNGLLAGTKGKK